jgi:hypothetical protein
VTQLGGTIGEQLVVQGAIEDDELTDFYQSRLLVPKVNPNSLARLPIKVVASIPSDMAIELRAIPVALDAENNLTVAMSDPSDRHAVDEIAFFTGAYVVRACATQMQIAWCLAHYYGHLTALGHRLIQANHDEPAPAPSVPERVPRTKGLTGRVEATRHKAIAPTDGPILNAVRPNSGELDLPPPDLDKLVEAAPVHAVAPPEEHAAEGVPQPRARSISGEIRVPGRRAPSIKPVIPDEEIYGEEDDSAPVITMEVDDTSGPASPPTSEDPTGPMKIVPKRRKVKTDPPELAARAGEVELATGPVRTVDEAPRIIIDDSLRPPTQPPASGELSVKPKRNESAASAAPSVMIEVEEEPSAAVMIHDTPPKPDAEPEKRDSEPVLLERRRTSDQPPLQAPQPAPRRPIGPTLPEIDDDEVVVLEPRAKKPSQPRPQRDTKVGIGALPAITRIHRDTEAGGGIVDELEDVSTDVHGDDDGPTRLDLRAAPGRAEDTTDEGIVAPPSPDDTKSHVAPPPRSKLRAESEPVARLTPRPYRANSEGDEHEMTTAVMSAVELDEAIPDRTSDLVLSAPQRSFDYDPQDEGWGPPGTTIPPPLLGAIPGSDDEDGIPSKGIPIDIDSAPLIVAPPSPPEPSRGSPALPHSSGTVLVRALEQATSRSIDLINSLEKAQDRDAIIRLMIDHLAVAHRRAGFFAIKPNTRKVNELVVFAMTPKPELTPTVALRLDKPSTLQDVVGTRLPYRGPMHDDASRSFLTFVLGACPPEILLVPVAIRERVVGVLFGDHRVVHTFDDQLALAARAAGMALERVLKAKK